MRTTLIACCAALFIVGCGATSPTPEDVNGVIRLDRQPMPDGRVYFIPASGAPPVVAEIKAGAFELKAVPGSYRIEVRMFRDRVPWPGEPHDKQINVIPPRFNAETTLSAEVKADGPNEFTFEVSSR
jgi:hypothetical protein